MNCCGIDLSPNYRLHKVEVTEYMLSSLSQEESEKRSKEERQIILKRNSNFNMGVDLHKNMQNIDIELIEDIPEGWSPFDEISDIGLLLA